LTHQATDRKRIPITASSRTLRRNTLIYSPVGCLKNGWVALILSGAEGWATSCTVTAPVLFREDPEP
jgi:hypothetical protein